VAQLVVQSVAQLAVRLLDFELTAALHLQLAW
jgi:hypothetical protein